MADDQIVALGDTEDDAYDSLAGTIKAKFQASENARQFDEKRWRKLSRTRVAGQFTATLGSLAS